MKLTFHDHRVNGAYAYVKYNKPIPLSGSCAGGTLALQESDSSGRPTGCFRGSFSKPEIRGRDLIPLLQRGQASHVARLKHDDYLKDLAHRDDPTSRKLARGTRRRVPQAPIPNLLPPEEPAKGGRKSLE